MPNSSLSFKNYLGFTLIEILITISIVSLVFGVVISSSLAIQKNGRDAQRKSDIQSFQSALQHFYADQNYFPDSIDLSSVTSITECTGANPACSNPSKAYLPQIPKDPSSVSYKYYSYSSYIPSSTTFNPATTCTDPPAAGAKCVCNYTSAPNSKCHYYILCAKLENAPSPVSSHCQSVGSQYNYEANPL